MRLAFLLIEMLLFCCISCTSEDQLPAPSPSDELTLEDITGRWHLIHRVEYRSVPGQNPDTVVTSYLHEGHDYSQCAEPAHENLFIHPFDDGMSITTHDMDGSISLARGIYSLHGDTLSMQGADYHAFKHNGQLVLDALPSVDSRMRCIYVPAAQISVGLTFGEWSDEVIDYYLTNKANTILWMMKN